MMKFIQDSWLVLVSSLVFGLLVAGVNGGLKDRIAANKISKRDNSMKVLLGDKCKFEKIVVKDQMETEITYFKATEGGEVVGYCFIGSGKGYSPKIELLIAVDSEFKKCKGYSVLLSTETPGFGDKIIPTGEGTFNNEFVGSPCPTPSKKLKVVKVGDMSNRDDMDIVAISGATISSLSVTKIVNNTILKMRDLILD